MLSFPLASSAAAWRVCRVHPWVEADAAALPVLLRAPADSVEMSGPRNDWLTGAVAIAADEDSTVTVSLKEPAQLRGKMQLRVVGQVRERENRKVVWDPLISKEDLPDMAKNALNFEQIKDFPKLKITPDVPAFLWLTVDLRCAASGEYTASLQFTDDKRKSRSLPVRISVLKAELPVENPLFCIAWQWTNSDKMIRDFVEHGINAAWREHEAAWKAGARFLLFQFSPSFSRKPVDDNQKEKVKKELVRIWEIVDRLKIPRSQWALNPADEPCDKTAQIDSEYGRLIKSIRPETPLWYDPAWGKLADSNQNNTTTEGTLKIINPITDVYCPYCWHLWDNSGALEYMRSTRKTIWSYEIMPASATRRPSVGKEALRRMPWLAWKYRLSGLGIFNANSYDNDPWLDLDPDSKGYANYSFTYPGASGIMSSRGFEAFRQGIQEYKRFYALNKLGVSTKTLDSWAEAGTSAQSVETFDAIRKQMDSKLVELTAEKQPR